MKGYTQAVLWVAQEDDPEITDLDEIRACRPPVISR